MRVLLVMPTGIQAGYDDYFSTSPLGIETLAAYARPMADVVLADLRRQGRDVEGLAESLMANKPDIVGLSLNSAPHTKFTLALAAAMKRRNRDVSILVGGQQASFIVDEMLMPGNIDAVIRGEGELTFDEILKRGGRDFAGIQGVSWRKNGGIQNEPDRPLIENLDTILLPDRSYLTERSGYRMGKYRLEGIESSRGCTFQCSFCSVRNFHRGRWRPKSAARVLQELDVIREKYNEKMVVYFADDNFSTDINRVREICKGIIERKTPIHFWCQARVDTLVRNPDVVELMGQAQFSAVLIGIETPVQRLLKLAKKGTSLDQIMTGIELLHKNGVGVWGTFTMGLPGETPEETKITADFIPTTMVDVAQITVATPIPGSTLYDEAKAAGDIIENDWDFFDFTSPTLKGQLPKKEMDAIMQKAYLGVYMSKRFFMSLFSQKTNIDRLRRTAFGVFWTFIKLILKERIKALFGFKAGVQAREAAREKTP